MNEYNFIVSSIEIAKPLLNKLTLKENCKKYRETINNVEPVFHKYKTQTPTEHSLGCNSDIFINFCYNFEVTRLLALLSIFNKQLSSSFPLFPECMYGKLVKIDYHDERY